MTQTGKEEAKFGKRSYRIKIRDVLKFLGIIPGNYSTKHIFHR